jgi:phosphate uptake regulator
VHDSRPVQRFDFREALGRELQTLFLLLRASLSRPWVMMSPHVVAQVQLALTLLVRPNVEIARALVEQKDRIRVLERAATQTHLSRLRQGLSATLETTALHLDVPRDLKRINAHIVSAAYPILETSGEIRGSRLKQSAQNCPEQADAQLRTASPG